MTGDSGTYNLSGSGQLTAGQEYIGYSGTGSFSQTGGTDTAGYLYLGLNAGSIGAYHLSGGQVNTLSESVGGVGAGSFVQSAGSNSVSQSRSENAGNYQLGGGTLQINGGLTNEGVLSGGTAAATLSVNGVLDLTAGSLENLNDVSLSMGANSLPIVPAGYNVATQFGSIATLGLTHNWQARRLTCLRGKDSSAGPRSPDPVNCQGSITAAASGAINLSGELTLSGTGMVVLGNGIITTERFALVHQWRVAL